MIINELSKEAHVIDKKIANAGKMDIIRSTNFFNKLIMQ